MSSVDVVVPCYKYGHFLRESVESVLTQSMVEVRVLIIDDESPDNTAEIASEIAREDSRITFLRHHRNKGHIASYNEGIDWADSDYFLLLSADDYLLPGALSRATALMDTHPEITFAFGGAIERRDDGVTKPVDAVLAILGESDQLVLTGRQYIELTGVRNPVPTPTVVVRTDFQKKVGGYQRHLPHSGDMEMWLRLAAFGSVGVIKGPQAVYRRHSANMSLSYTANHWVADLEQRKAAIETFLESAHHVLPKAEELHSKMRFLLAREALGWASTAFNYDDIELCDRLSRLAIEIDTGAKSSLPWHRLSLKRQMGRKRWLAIQPAINRCRQWISQ